MPEVIPEHVRIEIKELVLAGELDTEIREIEGYWGVKADPNFYFIYVGNDRWCQYILSSKVRVMYEETTEKMLRCLKILRREWL